MVTLNVIQMKYTFAKKIAFGAAMVTAKKKKLEIVMMIASGAAMVIVNPVKIVIPVQKIAEIVKPLLIVEIEYATRANALLVVTRTA